MKLIFLILILSFSGSNKVHLRNNSKTAPKQQLITNISSFKSEAKTPRLILQIKNKKVSKFAASIYKDAFFVSQKYGIPLALVIGQACLESGYGKSSLCKENKNFFGIRRNHKFCKYKTKRSCFLDYAGKVLSSACYKSRCKKNLIDWYNALKDCNYFGENEAYCVELNSIILKYNFHLL